MSWQIALGLLVVVNTCSVVLTKVAADLLPRRSLGIFYQYLFCAILATIYAFSAKEVEISSVVFWIGAVGAINAFGNYFQWQASALSLSRTALFFPLMEVVAIVLALTFLGEAVLWNLQLIFGAGLCFLAMYLLRLPARSGDTTKETLSTQWLLFALGMVLIFGIAGFLLKVFSFTIPRGTFLMGWYIGAFLGSFPILWLERQNPIRVTVKTILIVSPVSLAIIGALFSLYWTYQLGGPVSLVLPIRGMAITIIPVLVGWSVFRERKGLSQREWWGFLTGIVGAVLVLLR